MTEPPTAQTCANIILEQAVFSPWHKQFIAAAETAEQIDYLARSYEKAIQLTNQQPRKLVLNLGCQFWLAKVYAYKLDCEEDALSLWESISKDCETVWDTFHNNDGYLNYLQISTLEEIGRRKEIKDIRAALPQTVTNTSLYGMTRKMTIMGKAMEQRREPAWHARQGYLTAIRLCLASAEHRSSADLLRCLGDALVALGEYGDAQYVLGLCARPNRLLVEDTGVKCSHDYAMCDNCIAYGGSPKKNIQGFRFKCVTCAEMDLCKKCFTARQQGLISACVRSCNAEHTYIKIPGPNWKPGESRAAIRGNTSPNLRRWLDGLRAKYQDSLSL